VQDESLQDGAPKVPKRELGSCAVCWDVSMYVGVVWQGVTNISKRTSDSIFRVTECREIRNGNKVAMWWFYCKEGGN
jgi:hypothetical protein